MKMVMLGKSEIVNVLALFGVEGIVVEDKDKLCVEVERLKKDKEIGVILISETLADSCRKYMDNLTSEKILPIVIELPDDFSKKDEEAGSELKRLMSYDLWRK